VALFTEEIVNDCFRKWAERHNISNLIGALDQVLAKAELGRGSCGMNYDGGKLATGVKEIRAALKGMK
jgi:hypothetical protein